MTFTSQFTKEEQDYAVNLYSQGYFPKWVLKEFEKKFGKPLKSWRLDDWRQKHGIPPLYYHRHFTVRPSKTCPVCGYNGQVYPAGGSKNKQRYICPTCGTNFSDTTTGLGKYTESIRELARKLYIEDSHSTFESVAEQINNHLTFEPPLSARAVKDWVTAKNLRHLREQELKNRIYSRIRKYGSKGYSTVGLRNVGESAKKRWEDQNYKAKVTQAIHDKCWKQHTPELRTFCLDLYRKNPKASIRSICREAGNSFGIIPSHNTVVSWLKKQEGFVWKRYLMSCPNCPKCGSDKVIGSGHARTKEGKKQVYKCLSCNFHFRDMKKLIVGSVHSIGLKWSSSLLAV